MSGNRTRTPTTDTDHLARALERLAGAREDLQAINLRHYRGNDEMRGAIQEARTATDDATEWTREALQQDAPQSIDLRGLKVAANS